MNLPWIVKAAHRQVQTLPGAAGNRYDGDNSQAVHRTIRFLPEILFCTVSNRLIFCYDVTLQRSGPGMQCMPAPDFAEHGSYAANF
jgi:hypothetical protein